MFKYWIGSKITSLSNRNIIVFGSNPEGRHGKGAAKLAMKYGAKYGVGRGLMGQTYALPTKNLRSGFFESCTGITYAKSGNRSITPNMIRSNIDEMYNVARLFSNLNFIVIYQNSGTNLSGYTPLEMINMFTQGKVVPDNVFFHESFEEVLNEQSR